MERENGLEKLADAIQTGNYLESVKKDLAELFFDDLISELHVFLIDIYNAIDSKNNKLSLSLLSDMMDNVMCYELTDKEYQYCDKIFHDMLKKILSLRNLNEKFLLKAIDSFQKIQDFDTVILILNRLLSRKGNSNRLGLLAGILVAYMAKGDHELALKFIDKSLKIKPDLIQLLVRRVFCYSSLGKNHEVIKYGEQLISKKLYFYGEVNIAHNIAISYFNLRKYKKTFKYIDIVLNNSPKDVIKYEALQLKAKSYSLLGKYGNAIKVSFQGLKEIPDDAIPEWTDFMFTIGHAHYKMGHHLIAKKYMEDILKVNKSCKNSWDIYKQILFDLGDYKGSLAVAIHMSEKFGEDYHSLKTKMFCYYRLGNIEYALENAFKLHEIDANNKFALDILGKGLFKLGRYESCIYFYELLLKIEPEIPLLYVNIGNAYFILGDYEKSKQYYLKVLNTPNAMIAYFRLSEISFIMGDETSGKEYMKKYISQLEFMIFDAMLKYDSDSSFKDIRDKYEYTLKLNRHSPLTSISDSGDIVPSKPYFEGVLDLSDEIINQNGGKLKSEKIVTIPMFIKEHPEKLIQALSNQSGDFKILIYLNAYKPKFTKQQLQKKLAVLDRLLKKNGLKEKTIVLTNLYDKRVPIGSIRSDMLDSLVMAFDEKINDPIAISLDADVYKLQDGYIQGVIDMFKSDTGLGYVKGKIRWNDHNEHNNYVWFSEKLGALSEVKGNLIPSSGASSSYRLKKYMLVGGYDRTIKLGEDINLGYKMVARYGISVGKMFGKKIWTDPRRGELMMMNSKTSKFYEQWNGDFDHVDKSKINLKKFSEYDDVIKRFRDGGVINEAESCMVRSILIDHIGYNPKLYREFQRFWNVNMGKSLYKVVVDNNFIDLVEKDGKGGE